MFAMVATGVQRGATAVTRNSLVFGGLILVLGLIVLVGFGLHVPSDAVSTFRFTGGGDPIKLPEIPAPTQLTNIILGLIIISFGIYQLVRGFASPNAALGATFGLLVVAFLTWSI